MYIYYPSLACCPLSMYYANHVNVSECEWQIRSARNPCDWLAELGQSNNT